ncbi:hypothetical protein, partial [Thiolapillus sp.]|uniref:hypothetical protein n=1 Tax=Thiolapillus sp. TaxID=2017437 RepID=UPI003AF92C3A
SQTLARPGEMPAKYFRLPSATHGGLSLQDQGSENNGETSARPIARSKVVRSINVIAVTDKLH